MQLCGTHEHELLYATLSANAKTAFQTLREGSLKYRG